MLYMELPCSGCVKWSSHAPDLDGYGETAASRKQPIELPCSGSITGFLTRLSSHAKYGAPMLRVYHLELSRSRS